MLDYLFTLFSYKVDKGDPYPYQAFFTEQALKFYASKECKIRKLIFRSNDIENNEEIVSQMDIYSFWKLLNSADTSLDQVNIQYQMDDDLIDKMFQDGYDESHVINLVRTFPPREFISQMKLTVSALKAIYSVQYDNMFYKYSNVVYDQEQLENVGIGYSIRENIYHDWQPKNIFSRFWKRFLYKFNDFFVIPNQQYYMVQ